jgi:hypothetical protein
MNIRIAFLCVVCGAAALAGCPQPDTTFPTLPPPIIEGEATVPGSKLSAKSADRFFVVVRLRIATIEVPVGTASGSEEIWSYLDEESIAATRSGILGRNGFRVGLGRRDSWDDVAAILKKMTAKKSEVSMMMARPGVAVPFVLKRCDKEQTVFTFYEDRTLRGADYPPGENLLAIVCTLNEDDPTRVLLTGVPQLRSNRRRAKVMTQMGRAVMAYEPDLVSLRDLTFQLSIPSEDFIVIGPGAGSRRLHSAGHEFLVRSKSGIEFETVLVLIPEVFAAPIKAKPTSLIPETPS